MSSMECKIQEIGVHKSMQTYRVGVWFTYMYLLRDFRRAKASENVMLVILHL